jgi:catechol 2,3-dioxygenase
MSLQIERAHYVALNVENPEEVAQFATDKMGFSLAHVDDDGSHYLKLAGPDPYSLIYGPGEPGIDHISYIVPNAGALSAAAESLRGLEVGVEEITESPLWGHAPAIRFHSANGHLLELTTGVRTPTTIASALERPEGAPAPIAVDHIVTRNIDPEAENAFATDVLGLSQSAMIGTPDGAPLLTFFRGDGPLFHCYAAARAGYNGLHHFQVTVKDPLALYAAHEAMSASGVETVWGPVRHGPGHNIAFYVLDGAGNFVEYSAEEEIILDRYKYTPRFWPATDQKSMDEWGTQPPDIFF